jgi:hypothetical protein
MRALAWLMLAAAMASASAAKAQTYDPNFPVCLQVYGRGGGYIACDYMSMDQCRLSAAGRAAQCQVNPFYANPFYANPYDRSAHYAVRRPHARRVY